MDSHHRKDILGPWPYVSTVVFFFEGDVSTVVDLFVAAYDGTVPAHPSGWAGPKNPDAQKLGLA
jgi:hypothetical protein